MSRSPFGWDLPPGVTHSMIDRQFADEDLCESCGKVADDEGPNGVLCLKCLKQTNPERHKIILKQRKERKL